MPGEPAAGGDAHHGAGQPGRWRLMVAVLVLVNIFNFVDRQLPFILAEAIKRDLDLSDTQLGILGGVSFAVVYSTLALPLARLADRSSPKWVLTGCLLVWSSLTAAGGAAQNFVQLVASRAGVAAGEAGSTPAAHSMISAVVPAERRGLAMGVFSLGVPVGVMLGLVLGGVLNDLQSWRFAMVAMGAPGILIALLCAVVLPSAGKAQAAEPVTPFTTTLRRLWSLKSYANLCIGLAVFGVGTYGTLAFTAPFMARAFGMSSTHTGLGLGLITGIGGGIGALGAGWLADVFGRRSPGSILLLPAGAFVIAAPLLVAAWFAPSAGWALAFLVFPHMATVSYVAPAFAVARMLARPSERAMSSAILLFGLSLVGASVGPFLIGAVSDALQPELGRDALRYALCIGVVTNLWAAFYLWRAARRLPADLAGRDAAPPAPGG